MATELDRRDIRLFDYAKQFAQPFRDAIRAHTERLRPGAHLLGHGALCDIPAVARQAYRQHLHSLRPRQVPSLLLLLHRRDARALFSGRSDMVSIPALFYLNGHNWLDSKLRSTNIFYELQDNVFAAIDWEKAQQLSDKLMVKQLHTRLDAAVAQCLSDLEPLGRYHWSILQ